MIAPLVPVITLDGPSASGKGTIAQIVAARLGFGYLDSGAIYRALAWQVLQKGQAAADEDCVAHWADGLDLRFDGGEVWVGQEEVGDAIRTVEVGTLASKLAALPKVRAHRSDCSSKTKAATRNTMSI